ncbi:MAG: hypothetical protein HZB38_10515 [Planctomycetes bacterium]|nr:hypothetical protein [Planctomycetota bacterium]
MTNSHPRRAPRAVHLGFLALAFASNGTGAAQDPTPPPPHEIGFDAPAPAAAQQLGPIAPYSLRTRGGFESIQVNTNADGLNIVGDAGNEPSLSVDRARPNRLVIGWRQFASISSNFREAGVAYSRDGGHTWTNAGVLGPGEFRTDPVLDVDSSGRFFYHSLFGTALLDCDIFKSVDGGRTWLPPVRAGGGDKNWLVVDRSGGIGDGNVYTIWRADYSCCGWDIFNRSFDAGATFSAPTTVPHNPALATMAVDPDGAVYVAGVNIVNRSQFFVVKSSSARDAAQPIVFEQSAAVAMNGALTFIASGTPNPAGLLGQPWIAVDSSDGPARGTIYMLASVDPVGTDPQNVHFVCSTNGGATWSAPIRVNDDGSTTSWQWFGTLGVAPNGRLDAIWCDTTAGGSVRISELRYSSSSDGGSTWSPSVAVSNPFDSYLGWPNQNKIGDYYQVVSDNVGASVAWSATFSGEQDIYFLRIGEYDCNGNGTADSLDIAQQLSADLNHDGIPDECQCLADLTGDLNVDVADLVRLLGAFGRSNADPAFDPASDPDRDLQTGLSDLAIVLARFGTECP